LTTASAFPPPRDHVADSGRQLLGFKFDILLRVVAASERRDSAVLLSPTRRPRSSALDDLPQMRPHPVDLRAARRTVGNLPNGLEVRRRFRPGLSCPAAGRVVAEHLLNAARLGRNGASTAPAACWRSNRPV